MADISKMIPEGATAVHEDGRTAVFRNGKWNLGGDPSIPNFNRSAPGAAFLPQATIAPSKSEEAYFRKLREDTNPSVAAARAGVDASREMEQLMEKQQTGGIYSLPFGIGTAAGWFDPEIRRMDSIQSQAARQNRQPGEGTISDFDAQQFMSMTYGKDKPTETNKLIIRAKRLADDATIQRRQFQEWHFNKFGTTSGSEEAWDRYAQDNPIFNKAEGGTVANALNPNRQNWRQYFGDVRGKADTMPTAPAQDMAAAAAPNRQPARQAAPKPLSVDDGYRFKGGNPADPKNWVKVKN